MLCLTPSPTLHFYGRNRTCICNLALRKVKHLEFFKTLSKSVGNDLAPPSEMLLTSRLRM